MKEHEPVDFLVMNSSNQVIKTYQQYGSAKKLAEEINGAVFTNFYEVKKKDDFHQYQASMTKMCDFRHHSERED